MLRFFFNDLKGNVSLIWRREFNKVRFKEIEPNKIIKNNGIRYSKILNEYFNQIVKSAKPRLKIKDIFISLGLKGRCIRTCAWDTFRFTILKEDKQDELMNRCKYIALKPLKIFTKCNQS